MPTQSYRNQRRPKVHISPYSINVIHRRNPWVPAWWSAAFPGFGHILLGSYVKGFVFIGWEFLANIRGKVNHAIIDSFTGNFPHAKIDLNEAWLLLYCGVYVFGIWDSYRSAVDLNKYALLADREQSRIPPAAIGLLEVNLLNKRSPLTAAIWSSLLPGLGHLYTHRLTAGFTVLGCWVFSLLRSRGLEAFHLTCRGDFAQATAVTDPVWLLFLPSILVFAIYDSYTVAVEYNRLFDTEQAGFCRDYYQPPEFRLPV